MTKGGLIVLERVEAPCPHSSGQTTEGNCARCGAKP